MNSRASPTESRAGIRGIRASFSNCQDDTRIVPSPPATPKKSNRHAFRMPMKRAMLTAERKSNRRSFSGNVVVYAGENTANTSKRRCGFAIIDDPTIPSPSKPAKNKRLKAAYLPVHVRQDEANLANTKTSDMSSFWNLETVASNTTHLASHTVQKKSSMKHFMAMEGASQSLAKARLARDEASDDATPEISSGENEIDAITSGTARISIVADEEEEDSGLPANDRFFDRCSNMR